MRIKHYQRGQIVKEGIVLGIIIMLGFWVFASMGVESVNKSVDNKLEMLCQSAKKSGNEQWLKNCDTYYKTGNPLDIQTK